MAIKCSWHTVNGSASLRKDIVILVIFYACLCLAKFKVTHQ